MPALQESKSNCTTLVVGLGNTLQCDDGLGVRAVEMLVNRDLPPDVKAEALGTPGVGLINIMEGWSRVYIIDAAHLGQQPGTWRRFEPEEVRLIASEGLYSLHETEVADVLALSEAVGLLPDEVILYGMQPECIAWGEQLSLAVQTALPHLVDHIYHDLWKRKG